MMLMSRISLKNMLLIAILLAIIIPLVLFGDTYIHEQGHVLAAAGKYGINFHFQLHLTPDYAGRSGSAIPNTIQDCEKFNSLSLADKQYITHAGVRAELAFFIPILIILGLLLLLYSRRMLKDRKYMQLYLLSLLFVLCLAAILYSLGQNVFNPGPLRDWNVVNFTDCRMFG